MIHFTLLTLIPCVFGAKATDPVTSFDHIVNQETERMWNDQNFDGDSQYGLDDAHQFIRDYDTDGDGVVTRQEFDFHWAADEPTMVIIGHGLFLEYDDNQDGNVTASDIDAQYGRMDQNKDGHVDKKEFKNYYHQLLTFLFILRTQHIENPVTTTP